MASLSATVDNTPITNSSNSIIVMNKETILKNAQISGLILLHDRELAWTIGEWKAHNKASTNTDDDAHTSNIPINWDEILDIVCFELQKRIVHQRWRPSFEHKWLPLLIPTGVSNKPKRNLFVNLMNEAQQYCHSKLLVRNNFNKNTATTILSTKKKNNNKADENAIKPAAGAQHCTTTSNRWSGLSQVGFDLLFPRRRRKQGATALEGKEDPLDGTTPPPRKRRRNQPDGYHHHKNGGCCTSEEEDGVVSTNDVVFVKRARSDFSPDQKKNKEVMLTVFVNWVYSGDHCAVITDSTRSIVVEDTPVKPILLLPKKKHAAGPSGHAAVEEKKRDLMLVTAKARRSESNDHGTRSSGSNLNSQGERHVIDDHSITTEDDDMPPWHAELPDQTMVEQHTAAISYCAKKAPPRTALNGNCQQETAAPPSSMTNPTAEAIEAEIEPDPNIVKLLASAGKKKCFSINSSKRGLRWEPNKFHAFVPPPCILTQEHQELAFLLEQAPNLTTPWKHVEKNMTSALKQLMESKAHLVSFRQHGHKFRCLVGEKACARRIAFESYRMDLRNSVFAACAADGDGDGSPQQEATQIAKELKPAPVPLAPAGVIPVEQPKSPHCTTTERSLLEPAHTAQLPIAALRQPTLMERMVQESGLLSAQNSPVVVGIMAAAAAAVAAIRLPPVATAPPLGTDIWVAPIQVVEEDKSRKPAAKAQCPSKEVIADQPARNSAVPTHIETTGDFGCGHNGASDLTTHEAESESSVNNNDSGMHSVRSYVSTMQSYQLFSSSMRREAHLLLHISQWQTWHATDHSNGSMFAENQETIMNEFRDDELHLSRQACKKASSCIPYTNIALLDLAKRYASFREKTWIWWCDLVQGCCVEFAAQSPRVWDDFEYTQRSLWEYFAQLEIEMREYHFQDCLLERGDAAAADISPLLEQHTHTVMSQGSAESGHYVNTYISSLNEYLTFRFSVSNKTFLHGYLRVWMDWLENRDERAITELFLEGEENMLEKFRSDEHARVEKNLRVPFLPVFNCAYGESPLLVREIELYLALREKLWYFFCREILWESWKGFISNETPNSFKKFESTQKRLWSYFEKMERALLKVHSIRCSKLSQTGSNLISPPQATLPIDAAAIAMMGSPLATLIATQAALAQATSMFPIQLAPMLQAGTPIANGNPLSAIAGSPFFFLMGAQPSMPHTQL